MAVNLLNHVVHVEVRDRVAKLELNNPNVIYTLKRDMVKELIQQLKDISLSDEVQIVIMTGNEGAFSANFKNSIISELKNENDFYYMMDLINELIVTLYSMPKITISGIDGIASGLGISLALATDHIIASPSSQLDMNTMAFGLIPVGGTHFFLERRLGEDKAKHLIWETKTLSGIEALQLNLINELTKSDIQSAIDSKVNKWLNSPIQAMIKTKKILGEKNRLYLLKLLELEKYAQYRMIQTEDFQEYCQATNENRTPTFIGR